MLLEKKHTPKQITGYVFRYIALILIALFFMFPVVYMVLVSFFKDASAIAPTHIFPQKADFGLDGYKKFFEDPTFFRGTFNTLEVCFLNIAGVLIAATFCAFGLTKVHFKGQKLIFYIIIATVFLPGTVTSIPLYTIYTKIGWINNLYPLWVPIWFGGGAMNIFLIRQFMRGIPKSISESAVIDGASSFQILMTIIVPLIKPILLYLAVTGFISCWNDYGGPLLYLTSESSPKTLALLLFETFDRDKSFKLNAQMATGVLMMIPTTVLFAFFQKELTEGIATVGLKI